jgi:hypothetical protein
MPPAAVEIHLLIKAPDVQVVEAFKDALALLTG